MSFVHNLIGSSIEKAFAIIDVTYPVGSICTCSNGSKILTAKDTSGRFTFAVPWAGTWVVSCTDGTETKSANVSITTKYQAVSVELLYLFYVFKENEGAKVSLVEKYRQANGRLELNRIDYILHTYVSGASSGAAWSTDSPIDFTNFNTLYVECSAESINSTYPPHFGISTTKIIGDNNDPQIGIRIPPSGTSSARTQYQVDVSSITGMYYVHDNNIALNLKYYNIYIK